MASFGEIYFKALEKNEYLMELYYPIQLCSEGVWAA